MGLYMVNKIPLIRQLPYSVAFTLPEYCAMGGEAIMTGEFEPYYVYIDVQKLERSHHTSTHTLLQLVLALLSLLKPF